MSSFHWHLPLGYAAAAGLLAATALYLAGRFVDPPRSPLLSAARVLLLVGLPLGCAAWLAAEAAPAAGLHQRWGLLALGGYSLTGFWEGWRSWRGERHSLVIMLALVACAGMLLTALAEVPGRAS